MGRRRSALSGSPLLIGAVTTLIAIVAVYLSYNANNGLPFTPTYNINVELPEASGLQTANEVRIAGTRIGVISSITPHQNPATGRVTAIMGLKLQKSVEPLPVDTMAIVQSVSAIGLKYLDLEKGTSSRGLKPGATLPVSQAREPVEIQDLFNMFDKKTRVASQKNLTTFGDAFASRGIGLNNTIAELRPLVNNAIPALSNLAAPKTGLRELFIALDRAASAASPAAQAQANEFSDLDTTFTALAGAAPAIGETIEGGPPALRQATHSLPFEAAFVNKTATFMHLLRPSAAVLRTAAEPLGHAFEAGAKNLAAASALNTRLASALETLKTFSQNPVVLLGLEDFAQTAQLGQPLVAGLAPAQTNCNYVTLAFRNLASLLSESVGVGTIARVVAVLGPSGPNGEGLPASAPANGASNDKNFTTHQPINDNHLHVNPYPNVGAPGQPDECEAGNEHYEIGKTVTGNLSTNVGKVHDVTTRKTDLFGRPYPSAQLKDLPSATTSSTTTSGTTTSSTTTKKQTKKQTTKATTKQQPAKGKQG
jgi:virulence factor Mce-like protein